MEFQIGAFCDHRVLRSPFQTMSNITHTPVAGGGEAGVAPPGAGVPLRPLPQALLLPPPQGEPQTLLLLATADMNHVNQLNEIKTSLHE